MDNSDEQSTQNRLLSNEILSEKKSDTELNEATNQIVNLEQKSSSSITNLPFNARNFEIKPTKSNIPSPRDSKDLINSDQDSNYLDTLLKKSEISQESNDSLGQSSDKPLVSTEEEDTTGVVPASILSTINDDDNELRNDLLLIESDQLIDKNKTNIATVSNDSSEYTSSPIIISDNSNQTNLNKLSEPFSLNQDENVSVTSVDLNNQQKQEEVEESIRTDLQTDTMDEQKLATNYKPTNGQPIKILEIDPETKQILFNENELKEVFEKNGALDKMICVCSVAGDYRKGKSFLLNYCLRFLQNNHDFLNKISTETTPQWLGNVDEPLTGFSWRSGVDLETTGIWIWSELFPCKVSKNFNIIKTGSSNMNSLAPSKKEPVEPKKSTEDETYEDAFICLLDSQGAFDDKSTISDCATLFSILFLISSMQIYNVFHQLQEDNLHYLQLFTEYGRLIYEEGIHCKPFQRLTFLVRDWFSPNDFDFGSVGGEKYLVKKFKPEFRKSIDSGKNNSTKPTKFMRKSNELRMHENQMTRIHIQRCFDKIDCFLLPHPGKHVSSSNNYNGNWGDMSFEFLGKLKEFIEWWFSDLQVKRTTDYVPHRITGSEFIMFFKMLVQKLSEHSTETLKPMTIFESMAKISHMTAMEDSLKQFQNKMNILFGNDRPFVWPTNIDKICNYLEEQYRTNYLKKKKFGNRQFEREFIVKLNEQFKEICTYYQNLNELKCTILPAYILIICIIVMTNLLCTIVKLIFSSWLFSYLTQWIITIQLVFLCLAICVEIFGFDFGSSFVELMRRRLQCIYHLARAKTIDLNALNTI